ncbi:DUF4158 domain-containing protein [Nonomuraea sp. ZG12]|uniref:DUF4158 domain-containing protein n=1 Tax=Nonomuraea sp. ZG12 TaxID=3452207 RepID=UPI003F8BD17B
MIFFACCVSCSSRYGVPRLLSGAGREACAVTSVERTAYRVFPRLMMTRELYLFCSPQEEMAWVREKTDTDEHLLALTLALKCFQRLGRFAKAREVPVVVVEHVRRCLELKDDIAPVYASPRTASTRASTWCTGCCRTRRAAPWCTPRLRPGRCRLRTGRRRCTTAGSVTAVHQGSEGDRPVIDLAYCCSRWLVITRIGSGGIHSQPYPDSKAQS